MVLVMYESNVDGQRAWEKMECMVFHSDNKHLPAACNVYNNFLGLGDKESVIVNFCYPCPCFRKARRDQNCLLASQQIYFLIFSTKSIFFKTLEYQIGCNNYTQKVYKVGLFLSLLHFLTFSSKLDWGSYIISIAKNCLQENWSFNSFYEVSFS